MSNATRRFRATANGATFEVEVEGDAVRVRRATEAATGSAPATFDVASQSDESLRVRVAGRTEAARGGSAVGDGAPDSIAAAEPSALRAEIAISGDTTWVFIDGEVWTVDVEPAERVRRARASVGPEGLSAPMPATVIRILVEAGREVRRGETLLLLEAMKMELPVRAPRDGRVTAIHCQAGELVQPGVALVDLA